MEKLELFLPVKPYHLNQGFGANIPCVPDTPDVPVEDRAVVSGSDNSTCPVGDVKLYPLLGLPNGHTGNDLMAGEQPVYASLEGIVTELQLDPSLGIGIGITSQNQYDIGSLGVHNVKIRYWHLKQPYVQLNQPIKTGDVIGISDNTGFSSGDHLHWECKPQDKVNGLWVNTYQNNGFFGAVDALLFCNGYYACDASSVVQILFSELSAYQTLLALYQKLSSQRSQANVPNNPNAS